MTTHRPFSNATCPLAQNWEGFRVRAIFASGGLKDGLDIAKCIALGATLGGMAGQFLKAAAISTEQVAEMMRLTKRQIEVTMFAAGIATLKELETDRIQNLESE
jgi:isopentenyl-diphosphate delta-isomerase